MAILSAGLYQNKIFVKIKSPITYNIISRISIHFLLLAAMILAYIKFSANIIALF